MIDVLEKMAKEDPLRINKGGPELIAMKTHEIMNIKEVSGYLKIPISTIYKLAQSGEVPAAKVGKHWRFMKKDLDHLFKKKLENHLIFEGKF